jgi:hypothetical protein
VSPDPDQVALREPSLPDPTSIDERPVGAVEVHQAQPTVRLATDARVVARDEEIREDKVVVRAAADAEPRLADPVQSGGFADTGRILDRPALRDDGGRRPGRL